MTRLRLRRALPWPVIELVFSIGQSNMQWERFSGKRSVMFGGKRLTSVDKRRFIVIRIQRLRRGFVRDSLRQFAGRDV